MIAVGSAGTSGLPPAPAEPRWTLWGWTKGCKRWCDVVVGLTRAEGEAEMQERCNRLRDSGYQTRLVLLCEGEDPHRRWPQG